MAKIPTSNIIIAPERLISSVRKFWFQLKRSNSIISCICKTFICLHWKQYDINFVLNCPKIKHFKEPEELRKPNFWAHVWFGRRVDWHVLEINILTVKMLEVHNMSSSGKERGKGRDLIQSYDKSPYTHRKIQKATRQKQTCHQKKPHGIKILFSHLSLCM